jgi:hypothetical protein
MCPAVNQPLELGDGFPAPGRVYTTARLNIRQGAPSTRAPILQTVPSGTELPYEKVVHDGEFVNGNSVWLCDLHSSYFGVVQCNEYGTLNSNGTNMRGNCVFVSRLLTDAILDLLQQRVS